MLVLSRKPLEAVIIDGTTGFNDLMKVTVLEVGGGGVKLGFEVTTEVPVHRWEVWERIQKRGVAGSSPGTPLPR